MQCAGSCSEYQPKQPVMEMPKPEPTVPEKDQLCVGVWARKNAPEGTIPDVRFLWNHNFRINYWRNEQGVVVKAGKIVKSCFVSVCGGSDKRCVHIHE